MIRKSIIFIVVSILFLLGACNPKAKETMEKTKLPETHIPESETETSENKPENPEQTHEEVMEEVKSAIETEIELKLPSDVIIGDGYLTAITTSDESNYEVNFYTTNVPIPVNDPSLHDAHPYMIVSGAKFDSADAAKAKINYQPIIDGAEEIDLGHGVVGYRDAGAGSIFMTWHEGRWSFLIRNLNSESGNEEMIDLSKQIVAKLESQLLPAPQKIGAGTFDMDSDGAVANILMWQESDVVYEVYTADPLILVDTVTDYMKE
ncbi:hypothetical protein [Sporosarcina sp. JAI121]|uniref:hypothetical protein n=1 Tax=Sporosarcina sp. JAI121 TaxID=2723064 RepID=UPI0015CAA732|nr:hypothetical protein [Sporosarcina sp. JAI121]NYF24439.1 hypothetical protein [Sporosarcina sp. JAI121]